MKKFLSKTLLSMFFFTTFIGCTSTGNSKNEEKKVSDYKIALITDTVGTEQFILQAVNKMEDLSKEYGFQWTSIECTDNSKWQENTDAVSMEGYDLVIGLGWQAGEPFSIAEEKYPDVEYAVIDTVAENANVASYGFNESEGAYVLGVMVGTAFKDEKVFGSISSFQTQATYKYRWAYEEGVKSVIPDATFVHNFTNSYSDTKVAYDFVAQQQQLGAKFIFGGVSASANEGIYSAVLDAAENGEYVYTSGLSVDQTREDNPYILGGLLKNTSSSTEKIVKDFLNGEFRGGQNILGLKENAFGVVGITTDSMNYRNNEIFTDEVIEAGKKAYTKIVNGGLVIIAPREPK